MARNKSPFRVFTDRWARQWLKEEGVTALSRELYANKVRESEDGQDGEEWIEEGESAKIFLRDPKVAEGEAEVEVHAYENPPDEVDAGKPAVDYEVQMYVNRTFRKDRLDKDGFLTQAYNFFHEAGVATPVFWFIDTADTESKEGEVIQEVRVELRQGFDREGLDLAEIVSLGRLYLNFMSKMCE